MRLLAIFLLVCAFSVSADNPTEGRAMLVGSPAFPARDLFELQFSAINGRNIPQRDVVWVEPGTHRITVRVPRRFTESQINRRRQTWNEFAEIELELEAGKIYELRGRYNRTNRNHPYDIVIDSIRSSESG